MKVLKLLLLTSVLAAPAIADDGVILDTNEGAVKVFPVKIKEKTEETPSASNEPDKNAEVPKPAGIPKKPKPVVDKIVKTPKAEVKTTTSTVVVNPDGSFSQKETVETKVEEPQLKAVPGEEVGKEETVVEAIIEEKKEEVKEEVIKETVIKETVIEKKPSENIAQPDVFKVKETTKTVTETFDSHSPAYPPAKGDIDLDIFPYNAGKSGILGD